MIVDQLKQDQLQARKDRIPELSKFLTTLYSDVVMIGKNDGNRETTDLETVNLLKKFIKTAEEVKGLLTPDDVRYTGAQLEIDIINGYLPKQLSEGELNSIVAQIIEAREFSSMQDMGKTMQALKAMYEGTYDGATAVDIVRQQLGKL